VNQPAAFAPGGCEPSALAPGYEIDRYELVRPIAHGGMASVWLARQRGKHGFEKLVALKTILPKFAAEVRFREMLLDEARIVSRIEHPNVAQILDVGDCRDILYLVMTYVDGAALSKLNQACQRKNVSIPTGVVLRIMADACAGLHQAHELKDASGRALEVVHRDVSPDNILVSSKGVAKLIDFGIAKARSRLVADTDPDIFKGKTVYMSPEQALGDPVDRRADVWSVGSVLYKLLAGRPPYRGQNLLATLQLLLSGQPPAPLPSSVHPAIASVVRRALEHEPKDRYATAADLREAIEDAMIEAMLPTTVGDVAAFAAEHLVELAARRSEVLDSALAASAERRRMMPSRDAQSSTTLRAASLDASLPMSPKPRSRMAKALLAVAAIAAAAATSVPFAMRGPKPDPVSAAAAERPPDQTASVSAAITSVSQPAAGAASETSQTLIPTVAVDDLPKVTAGNATWRPPARIAAKREP